MQVWNVLLAARWKYRTQKWRKKSPSGHHRTTLSGYIFTTKACIDNRKKLIKQQYLLHMTHNMVNFGPLVAEIVSEVWSTPAIFNGFRILACSSGRQPNFAALNRGRHLYSAGQPSSWALAHISSSIWFSMQMEQTLSLKLLRKLFQFWQIDDVIWGLWCGKLLNENYCKNTTVVELS